MLQHLGVLSIVVIWVGIMCLLRRRGLDSSKTISQHAAQTRSTQVYYFLLFALAMPLFGLFVYGWMIPYFNLPLWFGIFVGFGVFFQMVAVAIPETTGWRITVHRYSAFAMSLLLIPTELLVVFSSNIPLPARAAAGIAALYQIIIAAMLIPKLGYHQKVLWLQMSYVACFHIAILLAVYG